MLALKMKDDKKWREFRKRWLARFVTNPIADRMKTSNLTNTRTRIFSDYSLQGY